MAESRRSPNASASQPEVSFTGRQRRRTTRASVKWTDRIARWVITVGGLGVIVALAALVIYLCSVVVPLFLPGHIEATQVTPLAGLSDAARPVALQVDETRKAAWVLDRLGSLHAYRIDGGELVTTDKLSDVPVTSTSTRWNASKSSYAVALGREDGTLLLGSVAFAVSYPPDQPDAIDSLKPGQTIAYDNGVAQLTPAGALRLTTIETDFGDPVKLGRKLDPSPVKLVDYTADQRGEGLIALREDGTLLVGQVALKRNMMTGKVSRRLQEFVVPADLPDSEPVGLFLRGGDRGALLVHADGTVVRFDLRDPENPRQIETVDVTPDGSTVTAARMLAGGETLIIGDSGGKVSGWITQPYEDDVPKDQRNVDSLRLVKAHDLEPMPAAVTAFTTSIRDRQFAAADADGDVQVYFMLTSSTEGKADLADDDIENPAARNPSARNVALQLLAMAPNNDLLVGLTETGTLAAFDIENEHPGSHMTALWAPIWYEGYATPRWEWQSGGASDEVEPKTSFMPLLFGTLKATFYAMFFAVPIAILAAIYSSEFMHPTVRGVVKPTVEMMAGLPSVVLGFIGGVVLKPIVGNIVVGALVMVFAIPTGVFLLGWIWQLVPPADVPRFRGWLATVGIVLAGLMLSIYAGFAGLVFTGFAVPLLGLGVLIGLLWVSDVGRFRDRTGEYMPFIAMLAMVFASAFAALIIGPILEHVLFYGSARAWLNGNVGNSAWGIAVGWMLLLTPLLFVGFVCAFNTLLRPKLGFYHTEDRTRLGLIDGGRIFGTFVAAVGLATLLGYLLGLVGADLRHNWALALIDWSPAGTYNTNNALIIGVMMGFAVIPIIYTVSEDALSAVPRTLRSAALGAGATPWQTAIRVVLPVAMPGVFSACMIGLGRAVGETMIVLMAFGNTPVLDFNVFNGGRTFSANIAVELPEAAAGGTLYRYLFLSGLVLFAMTFVINTFAELVRIRFRKKAVAL